ncbi:MAG: hypothetical protein ABSB76_14780 [Streptosporangiaceae bacterium]|jgi:hypothetical protein
MSHGPAGAAEAAERPAGAAERPAGAAERPAGAADDDRGGLARAALAAVGELRVSLASLESHAARDHDRARAREAVIDRLRGEVERLRAGEVRALLRPVVTDLRRLREDLLTQASSVPEAMARDEVTLLLESHADSVALILERCGIVVVRPVRDSKFDPRQQQISAVVETGDRDLDGLVAGIVSDGYAEADGGRAVAPAWIAVYRYVGSAPDEGGRVTR